MVIYKVLADYTKRAAEASPDEPGIYELVDGYRKTVYIGLGMIRARLLEHLDSGSAPLPDVKYFKYEECGNKRSARRRHNEELVRFYKIYDAPPKHNKREDVPVIIAGSIVDRYEFIEAGDEFIEAEDEHFTVPPGQKGAWW